MKEREQHRVSSNGISVYSYKNEALHGFYISLFVRAGSMYESGSESGITHFFEHCAIRNLNKLYGDKLYEKLDRMGMELGASTYSEMVQFYISGASKHFGEGARLLTDLFSDITLSSSEIDAERKRIKAEIRESDDKRSLNTFTASSVFGGTSLEYSILGTNSSIDKIGKVRLAEFSKKALCRENVFLYVTGCFTDSDIDEILSILDKKHIISGALHENIAPVPEKFAKRDSAVFVKNADFTMCRLSFDLDMTRYSVAETDLVYDMLLSGNNSKLFIELSEKRGLCYDLGGGCERYKNIGELYFTFEVKKSDLYDALKTVVEVLNSMKHKPDVDSVKAGYVDNAYMLYDDSCELNFTFGYDNHIMDEKYSSIDERKMRYENITSERIGAIARGLFLPRNLTVTIKGDKKSISTEKIKEITEELLSGF